MFRHSTLNIYNIISASCPSSRAPIYVYLAKRSSHTVNNIKSSKVEIRPQPAPISKVTKPIEPLCNCDSPTELRKCSKSIKCQYRVNQVPVFIRTYGCQMNENDTSIIGAILQEYGYTIVEDEKQAEIYLLMTCAIRDSAESKVWGKLNRLKALKESLDHPLKQIGLLGCMAERLKEKALTSSGSVDIVVGPDAYRDLPRLFSINRLTKDKAVNCLLSFDETYSDIRPVTNIGNVTSFISITRGCDNLCSYCIVPFTRGKEKTRPLPTILDEVKSLMNKGVKEVTLLGQNVNSYRDLQTIPESLGRTDLVGKAVDKEQFAKGFKTVYKPRVKGLTFDVLLEEVAKISPELRVRFTSPHPKDFTNDVIEVISRYPNISRCVHLPAQSGSNFILEKMRRGYTKQAYLELVKRMRDSIPNLALTSDFIAGFCDETEDDHQETIDLIKQVEYNFIYVFPYSMRDKTHAYHNYEDNVDHDTKVRRVQEIHSLFRTQAEALNKKLIGTNQLVLIEHESRRSNSDWMGRLDVNLKAILPKSKLIVRSQQNDDEQTRREIQPGDYVVCSITNANSQTVFGEAIYITTQADYLYGRFGTFVNKFSHQSN